MRVSNTEATAWLLLLLSTTATTVESFIPTHQFNSLQLRQQQQSLIINYDNIPGQHDGENNEGEREHTKNNKRFGANIMEVITGQLYATKALAAGLAGVMTASIAMGDAAAASAALPPPSIMNDATMGKEGATMTVVANLESFETMPKSYISMDVETTMGNFPQILIADTVTVEAPVTQEGDATASATAPPKTEAPPSPPTTPTATVLDVQKVEDAAAAARAEKLALEKKLAEIRSDSAKKAAEKVKAIDVAPPTLTTTTTGGGGRDKLVAEEEARIEAAKRTQLEKIYKEQEKARLAAEKDAEKARRELEQRAEKIAQKARADAEKKAIEAKVKSVKDREAATEAQAKLAYQEAEKAQAARLRAEENRRKLERDSVDVNSSLEYLRQVEEAKKADAKAADSIRIKAMEERVKLDQEMKQVKGKEFDETMEDIALVAVPSAIIAGVVYASGALKRESKYESNMIGRDPSSTPYGMQDQDNGGGNSGPFGMSNPFEMSNPFGMGNQEESPASFESDNQRGFSGPSSPETSPMQGMQSTFNGPTEIKNSFGGGGMPLKKGPAPSSFGKAPFKKGPADSKGPFGGGGMPLMPTAKAGTPVPKSSMVGQGTGMPEQAASKTKAFGNVSPAPAFPAFQTPLKGKDTSGGSGNGFGSGPTSGGFGKAPPKGPAVGTPPKQNSSAVPSSFGKAPQKGFVGGQKYAGAKSPFGGAGMPTKTGPAPSSFGKAPLQGSGPFGGGGMPSKAASTSFGNAPVKGSGDSGPFGGGGMPSTAAPAFGKAPSNGSLDSKMPFGGGGMPSKAAAPSSFGKAPLKGTPVGGSTFAPGMPSKAESAASPKTFAKASFKKTPKSESAFGKAPSNGSLDSKMPFGGGGMPSKAAAPSSFGKAPLKGTPGGGSTFAPGMPSKAESVASPKSFAKASFKKTLDSKSPFGGGIPGAGGPVVGIQPTSESKVSSKSFGKAPSKGSAEKKKGPFGGKVFTSKEPMKGPFGKSLSQNTMGTKKASATSFGGAPFKGSAEKKSPFGGGGMPSKAAPGSFGKAPLKGPTDGKGPFGGGGISSQAAPGSFGKAPLKGPRGGMPSSSFGKAPLKGSVEKGPFGGRGGMPSQAKATSFGKAPPKGSADSKGSFGGGGGMPSKKGLPPGSFGKAPLKGAAGGGGGPAFSSGMPSKVESTRISFGKASSSPLFPNKGGIVAESDSSFVARDILLDAELGRGTPEIRSNEPPPSNLPPPPTATSNRPPVFGLGGAFGKSVSGQSGYGSPKSVRSMPKGPQPVSQGFSSVSPPNTNMPKMKQQMQPPSQAGRPGPGAPQFDSGMNQAPPQPNRGPQRQGSVPGEGARQGRSMRQPMADNFTPRSNMNTNQFADGGRPVRSQQPQPTANVPPPRQNFSQPPPQSAGGFQQGPADWKNQASPSPIGQFSNSVRDPQRPGGTRLGSLASRRQSQSPPGTARPTATGPVDNKQQYYDGPVVGPDDYQEVTVTDPRTGDRRTIRIPPPNLN